jgi:hypothetical protein
MRAKQAVVVVIDRLGAGWLGPYGNTWLETPHFNCLAAQSLLCENALADSPDLAQAYRAYWSGRHTLEPDRRASGPGEAASLGLEGSILVTDDERVSGHPLAAGFSEIRRARASRATSAARSIEETELFQLTAAAIEALTGAARAPLVWIHSRGMGGAWDAPLDYRNQFADEGDPEPPKLVQPPELLLSDGFDPDELLGLTQAYAGQVALADECLGMLLAALDEHPRRDETLLIVTSPRGYPLGEHRRVGAAGDALYAELLQVPLLVRFPGGLGALCGRRTSCSREAFLQRSPLIRTALTCCELQQASRHQPSAQQCRSGRASGRSARRPGFSAKRWPWTLRSASCSPSPTIAGRRTRWRRAAARPRSC